MLSKKNDKIWIVTSPNIFHLLVFKHDYACSMQNSSDNKRMLLSNWEQENALPDDEKQGVEFIPQI